MLAFNGGRSEGEWKVMAPFLASSVNVSRAKGKRSTKEEKNGSTKLSNLCLFFHQRQPRPRQRNVKAIRTEESGKRLNLISRSYKLIECELRMASRSILHFDSSSSPCTKFFNLKQIVGQGGEVEVSLAAKLSGA